MQYSWLEKMAQKGLVRDHVKDEIYRECSQIFSKYASTKLAARPFFKQYIQQTLHDTAEFLPGMMAFTAGMFAVPKVYHRLTAGLDQNKIMKFRDKIKKDPVFDRHKDKALARFDEILKIAPNVMLREDFVKSYIQTHLHSGFTPADLERLALAQLAYSAGSGATVTPLEKRMGKKASAPIEISDVAKAQALADVLCLTKTAAIQGSLLKNMFGTVAALAAAHTLIGVGSGAINVLARKHEADRLKDRLEKSYAIAMKQSDPLNEPLHQNKDKARQAFDTLVHFSPNVATNPSAARAFMNSVVSHDLGTTIGSVKELSEIEKNISLNEKQHPFLAGMRGAMTDTGFSRFFANLGTEVAKGPARAAAADLAGDSYIP